MFEWKVEDMRLTEDNYTIGNAKHYHCESKVSREDKIAFVDSLTDGRLSYILSLVDKFTKDKETMPKDQWGYVKTVSLKAWIKRNDKKYGRPVCDDSYQYGFFHILGCSRSIENSDVKGSYDSYKDLVDEVFYRQLKECEREERRYFLEHDEYSILKQKLRDRRYHTTFGVKLIFSSSGEISVYDDSDDDVYTTKRRDITIEEIKELLAKYEQIDALVKKLTAETHIVY